MSCSFLRSSSHSRAHADPGARGGDSHGGEQGWRKRGSGPGSRNRAALPEQATPAGWRTQFNELAIRLELRVALAEHGATAARSLTVERMVDGVETVLEGAIPPRK